MTFRKPIEDESTRLKRSLLLARYYTAVKAGNLQEDPLQIAILTRLEALRDALEDYSAARVAPSRWLTWLKPSSPPARRPKGVYIHGSVGRGKSMLLDLFFAATPLQKKRRVHFHSFMAEIHSRLHRLRSAHPAGGADPLAKLADEIAAQTWLLCFDEVIVTNIADAMILGRLFQALFEREVVMAATSNFPPEELYKDGLHRDQFEPFIALLQQNVEILTLEGPRDYRRFFHLSKGVYFAPLGAKTSRALDEAFTELTGQKTGHPDRVVVNEREVPVPQAARGVARFAFQDLCAMPLGASDYHALTQRFHTILLDQVPLLSPANHNEARRFMTLIDTLYEAKTKLVIGAAAPPDSLYPEGLGAFEFQRTASRLIEMQSEAYQFLPPTASGQKKTSPLE